MATVATSLVPSTTNSLGTAFGLFAGGLAVKWLIAAPFIVKLAAVPALAAMGATPMGLAGIGGVLVTSLAGYAVTHIAEVSEAASFIMAVKGVQVTDEYPNDPKPPQSTSNVDR